MTTKREDDLRAGSIVYWLIQDYLDENFSSIEEKKDRFQFKCGTHSVKIY